MHKTLVSRYGRCTVQFKKGVEYADQNKEGESRFIDEEGEPHRITEDFRPKYFKLKN